MFSTAAEKKAEITKWASADGEFRRPTSAFRAFVSTGPKSRFIPESGRYVLYVSLACPWAHRTLVVRVLKNLQDLIDVAVVDPRMFEHGWKFSSSSTLEGCTTDPCYGFEYLRDIYYRVDPEYNGRYTVPVLYDRLKETIVNNESSEIIRMLNSAFNDIPGVNGSLDLYPEHLQKEIDAINTWVYDQINNGVYKSGFATTQKAYDNHVLEVFKGLDRCEDILKDNEYLVGGTLTEADIRLWTSVVRFDCVYLGHFKCNLKSIEHNYPHILRWARKIYQIPGIAETVSIKHIKMHYYMSHKQINPTGIIPVGNGPDFSLLVTK